VERFIRCDELYFDRRCGRGARRHHKRRRTTRRGTDGLRDSSLEGDGFELVVPRHKSRGFPQHSGLIEGFETTDLKIQQKRCLTACGSLKRKKPQPGQIAYAIVSMEWLV